MIHISVETIPAKMYFRIQETGEIELLTDEKNPDAKKLQAAWEKIQEQHDLIPENSEGIRHHSVRIRLEQLSAKLECATLSAHHLKSLYDQDLMDILISYEYFPEGYVVKSQKEFIEDLKVVDREAESLQITIDTLLLKLPKKKDDDERTTFDQSVMSYAAFTGSGFIDPNKITLTQYYALVNMGKEKIKSLENGKG